nr:MAG TPA: hypothetical protein [Caudoviricetes sp.]
MVLYGLHMASSTEMNTYHFSHVDVLRFFTVLKQIHRLTVICTLLYMRRFIQVI